MIRIILTLIFLAFLSVLASWVSGSPGSFILEWYGYRVESTASSMVFFILLSCFSVWLCLKILLFFLGLPGFLWKRRKAKRQAKGELAIANGMMALCCKELEKARRYSKKASRILSDAPLTLLLEAQVAQLQGDNKATKAVFQRMLHIPETKKLAVYGLFLETYRSGNIADAKRLAQEALDSDPHTPWAIQAFFDSECAEQKWEAALTLLRKMRSFNLIGLKEEKRYRAVLLLAMALEAETTDNDRTLSLSMEAHDLAPDLVPAAQLAAGILIREKKFRKALVILEKTWRKQSHPDIAKLLSQIQLEQLQQEENKDETLSRAAALAEMSHDPQEGAIFYAQTALDAGEFSLARKIISPFLGEIPERRICLIMAMIEEKEYGNAVRARSWLLRAINAPLGYAWVADGFISPVWRPISPVTGQLDAFKWRRPCETFASAKGQSIANIARTDSSFLETAAVPLASDPSFLAAPINGNTETVSFLHAPDDPGPVANPDKL